MEKYTNMCHVEISGVIVRETMRNGQKALLLRYTSDSCTRMAYFCLVAYNDETERRFHQYAPYERDGVEFGKQVKLSGVLSIRELLINVDNISDMHTDIQI